MGRGRSKVSNLGYEQEIHEGRRDTRVDEERREEREEKREGEEGEGEEA